MRMLVCGGRHFSDRTGLFYVLDYIASGFPHGVKLVIHGGARGADQLAGEWASERGIPCAVFPANWEKHGKRAGLIRNEQMLSEGKPDLIVAFPGGAGTNHMVNIGMAAMINVRQITKIRSLPPMWVG